LFKQLLSDFIQSFLVLSLEVATRLDFLIQIDVFLNVFLEHRHALESEAEALAEESLNAFDITLKVKLGVQVARARHLREIDHGDVLLVIDHQVEFVEIAVHEPMLSKVYDLLDERVVHRFRVRQTLNVHHWVRFDQ